MNQKKKGFTLIELLAVIVILAIIAVIAVPIITNLMYKARKSLLKSTAYSYIQAADNKCFKEQLDGENGSFTYTSEDGVITSIDNINDYIKGKEPDKVQLSTTDECASTLAIYDKSLGVCAYKDYDMEEVLLANIADGTKCEIGKEIKDDSAPIFTGYACSNPGDIEVTEEKYFTFNLSTGEITGYSSEGPKDVVIPCQIGGKNVVSIGNSAFKSKGLTSVIMPDTIKTIGSSAFESNSITTLELGNSVETIYTKAFYSNKLTEVTFPDSLKTISGHTVWGVFERNKLTKVTFGSGLEWIGERAFYGGGSYNRIVELDLSRATNLKTIAANAFENNLITELELVGTSTTVGTDAFKNNQIEGEYAYIYGSYAKGVPTSTVLTSYAGADRGSIIIPDDITSVSATFSGLGISGTFDSGDGITSIPDEMFKSNSLTTVIIGDNVKTIGSSAFESNSITTLELGNSVETIYTKAFYSNKLTEVTFPDSLKTISGHTVWGVFERNKLTKVTFGSGLEWIGERAFYGGGSYNRIVELDLSRATNLKTIAANAFENNLISNLDLLGATSLTTISEKSFYNNKLTSLDIPTNVKTIGANAFASNPDLSEIFIHGKVDSTNFTSLGSTWNGNCTNIIYELNSCYTYSGNTITGYASSCSKKITIPTELDGNTITAIGENAFYNVGLTSVTIPKTVMIIGDNAFGNNSSLSNITVIGKTSESDFTSLGTLWYGTCTNITYGG